MKRLFTSNFYRHPSNFEYIPSLTIYCRKMCPSNWFSYTQQLKLQEFIKNCHSAKVKLQLRTIKRSRVQYLHSLSKQVQVLRASTASAFGPFANEKASTSATTTNRLHCFWAINVTVARRLNLSLLYTIKKEKIISSNSK